jgi:Xaa-Pro aminopeptidase
MVTASTVPAARFDVAAIQTALRKQHLDGWLLYDFRGLNPIAAGVAQLSGRSGHLATRRWFYLIPASGSPHALVHAIEAHVLDHLPGNRERYSGREQLEAGLARLLTGLRRVAMEYSPGCAIPYIARVDAGTIELVSQGGVEVVSSGDLVQQFSAVWDERETRSHLAASEKLYRVKDRAFDAIARRTREGTKTTEYDVQQLMVGWFRDEGMVSDSPPNVSAAENAGNPHYLPTRENSRSIGRDELVLLDLWAKLDEPGAVFADITWVGYTGRHLPARYAEAFSAVEKARDAATRFVQDAIRAGGAVRGWEVDREASTVLRDSGFGEHILHRTGHSLGESVHGNGVNMDDFETHDDRQLLPGTGFTIEPGLYFADFGVRSEINLIVHAHDATVSGPVQHGILALA